MEILLTDKFSAKREFHNFRNVPFSPAQRSILGPKGREMVEAQHVPIGAEKV